MRFGRGVVNLDPDHPPADNGWQGINNFIVQWTDRDKKNYKEVIVWLITQLSISTTLCIVISV